MARGTSLPFELACFPQAWFRFLRLPVVSYALPALIAVGQAVYHHRPPRNPLTWLDSQAVAVKQPARAGEHPARERRLPRSGAAHQLRHPEPGQHRPEKHPVARHGVQFLIDSVRPDGSWPIDSNLVYLGDDAGHQCPGGGRRPAEPGATCGLRRGCSAAVSVRHAYTGADPGGWGWTDLPGSVPDCDDSPGALLALSHLMELSTRRRTLRRGPWRRVTPRTCTDPPASTPCRAARLSWRRGPPSTMACGGCCACRMPMAAGRPSAAAGVPAFRPEWLRPDRPRRCALFRLANQTDVDQVYARALTAARQQAGFPVFPCPGADEMADGLDYLAKAAAAQRLLAAALVRQSARPRRREPDLRHRPGPGRVSRPGMMNTEPARRGITWLLQTQNTDGGWGGAAGGPRAWRKPPWPSKSCWTRGRRREAAE